MSFACAHSYSSQVDDTVIVERGDDGNKKRAALDDAGNSWYVQSFSCFNTVVMFINPSCGRYAKICYFFEPEHNGEKMFHARWYEHGSQTILQEVAHPNSQ